MSRYSLEKLCELAIMEGLDYGYVGVSAFTLCLLKSPDSLLRQAIQRTQRNPDHFKDLLLRYRPRTKKIIDSSPKFSNRLESLNQQWKKNGITEEKEITIALLKDVNVLSYAASILKVSIDQLVENVKESLQEGPIRFNTPTLNKGTNLTAKAHRGEMMPCIGRDVEIKTIAGVLLRMTKNMPVLIGEAGVGKTAVVEGFAQYLIGKGAPTRLKGCTVIDFPVSLFSAGHKYIGEMEKFALRLIEELKRNSDIILFLDEIHQVIGAGKAKDHNTDVAQILKPALARGEIKVIGASTLEEYLILEKDSAFERRINAIMIEEPSTSDTLLMVQGAKSRYEQHHELTISDEAIESAVKLSRDYLTQRKLPDKAFDLLDFSCARVKTFSEKNEVGREDILETLVEMTGVEIANVDSPLEDKVSKIEAVLLKEVIGQDKAVHKVLNSLKLAYGGLIRRAKPLGVFLFLGDSGCGKTHLAKGIATHLFGDDNRMLRVDMGEFTEAHSVSRLIGSPPGYKGHEEGGVLTGFIKNFPFSVILLDEVEKAHYQVADIFLALFGEGHITDNRGHTLDARNTICIMTSNHGIESLSKRRHLFLGAPDDEEMEVNLKETLDKAFRPELLNRLDEVIVFQQLEQGDLEKIARLNLDVLTKRFQELKIHFTVEDNVLSLLAEEAQGMGTGARPLERFIENKILLPLSEKRLAGELNGISKLTVFIEDSNIAFRIEK